MRCVERLARKRRDELDRGEAGFACLLQAVFEQSPSKASARMVWSDEKCAYARRVGRRVQERIGPRLGAVGAVQRLPSTPAATGENPPLLFEYVVRAIGQK